MMQPFDANSAFHQEERFRGQLQKLIGTHAVHLQTRLAQPAINCIRHPVAIFQAQHSIDKFPVPLERDGVRTVPDCYPTTPGRA